VGVGGGGGGSKMCGNIGWREGSRPLRGGNLNSGIIRKAQCGRSCVAPVTLAQKKNPPCSSASGRLGGGAKGGKEAWAVQPGPGGGTG